MTLNRFPGGICTEAVAVTPSDSTDLTDVARGLFIGVGGDISVETADGQSAVVFKNLSDGQFFPVAVSRVNSTSTTATDIVALR